MGSILDSKDKYIGETHDEIDCSHLVNDMLHDAGYSIDYQKTSDLHNSAYYDVIDPADAQPGDLIYPILSRNMNQAAPSKQRAAHR